MDRDEVVGLGDPVVGRITFGPRPKSEGTILDAAAVRDLSAIDSHALHALRAQNASLKELLQRFVASHVDLNHGEPCRCECCQEAITLVASWAGGKVATR